MPDPAAPLPKKSGPGRWILLGCGILTGLFVLGMSSCAGVFYFVYKGTDGVAEVGAVYLRESAAIESAVGAPVAVKRSWSGWNVQVVNDGGSARITYSISGPKNSGSSIVWLAKSAGQWKPIGARFSPANGSSGDVEIGTIPKGSSGRDWD